ncbi:MAG: UDP-N-acetylmuramoyl-tripeptide--D-alanyl-D-alanine ligase [Pseudomonadota bacterium]
MVRAWNAGAWMRLYRLAGLYRRTWGRGRKVVTVVGSTGKTTTVDILQKMLGAQDGGRVNHNYGLHLVCKLVSPRHRGKALVLEVGISRAGQMGRYAWMLRPDVAVVTTIGSDHHPSLGGKEGIFREKSLMVRALRPEGLAVLNGDDPKVRAMADLTAAKVVLYGLGPQNQVRAEDISLDWPNGSSFTLLTPGIRQRMALPLFGEHMVMCALACCAVALHLGLSLDEIAAALRGLTPLPGRMHPVWLDEGVCLLEDHNKGTAETFQAALDFLAKVPAKRKVVVLGALETPMGSGHRIAREFGTQVGGFADLLLVMGSDSKGMASAAKKAGMAGENIIKCGRSVHKATRELRGRLQPGDLVLIKGRRDMQLRRITLMLLGRPVSCSVMQCEWTSLVCDECGMLAGPKANSAQAGRI